LKMRLHDCESRNQIIEEIQRSGFEVVKARRIEDAEITVKTDAAIGCMLVDWGKKGLEGKTAAMINLMRRRGLDFPIILLIRNKRLVPRAGRPVGIFAQ
jgi:ornithine decarboxylase